MALVAQIEDYINRTAQQLSYALFNANKQRAFLEDLSRLVADGVPATKAIDTIRKTSGGLSRRVATDVMVGLASGQSIAEGMRGWFHENTIEVIRAGEQGGTLVKTLQETAQSLSDQTRAIGAVLAALIYPTIVVSAALMVSVFIKNSIFETFKHIQPIELWPQDGQILYGLANFIESWFWLLILIIILLVIGFIIMLQRYVGEQRNTIDTWPIMSLYRNYVSARFMKTLGLLLANGISLKNSLMIMQQQVGGYLAWHLYNMQLRLGTGRENIADVLDTGLIDEADIVRLKAIAQAKGFEEALADLGQRSADATRLSIIRMSKVTGGVLLAMGALLAIFMVLSIYSVSASIAI